MKNILVFLGCFLGLVSGVRAEEACMCDRMSDSLALVDLYWATGGEDWTYSTMSYYNSELGVIISIPSAGNPWNLNQQIDTWHGVELNDEGCVRILALNTNGLIGELPNLNLPNLQDFHCSSNVLSGNIPDFTSLNKLQGFFCNNNNISGSIPDFINLPFLQDFRCGSNNITGSIPDFINLSNLQNFSCNNNDLTGSIPNFNNLPELQSFYCSNNLLSGNISLLYTFL